MEDITYPPWVIHNVDNLQKVLDMESWKVLKKKVPYFKIVKTPGVGNYRLPSEFGYYENAKKN